MVFKQTLKNNVKNLGLKVKKKFKYHDKNQFGECNLDFVLWVS